MDVKHLLKDRAYQNIPLSFDEAHELGRYALEGCTKNNQLAQIQSIAILCALHNKATYSWRRDASHSGESDLPESAAEQIAGICTAVFRNDIGASVSGFLRPRVPYAIDNCGMGGDLILTANVSTIAAFIASAAGIPMCKHGSPANADAGRHGSSDFIELLGINGYASKEDVERCVEEECFGYTEALDTHYKRIHLQTHRIAMLPHMNDIIGPITNPLHPELLSRRLLGVNHLISPYVLAETYKILNLHGVTHLQHGVFVRGLVGNTGLGVDEVSVCEEGTQVAEFKDGCIQEYHLYPKDFGVEAIPAINVSPPNGMSKGDFSLRILKGEITGPSLVMVLANAAMLFYLAGRSSNLRECYRMASDVYESGDAYRKVLAIRDRMSASV